MRTILTVIGIAIAAFGVPFLINGAYNTGSHRIVTDWGATDVLTYWGSVLGGLATLLAIWINIRYEKRKERYYVLSNLLFDALDNLDANHVLSLKKCIEEKSKDSEGQTGSRIGTVSDFLATLGVYNLTNKTYVCKKLEIRFSHEEHSTFQKQLNKLRDYEERYIPLLLRFGKERLGGAFVLNILEKIEDIYSKEYNDMVDSVHDSLKKFESKWW